MTNRFQPPWEPVEPVGTNRVDCALLDKRSGALPRCAPRGNSSRDARIFPGFLFLVLFDFRQRKGSGASPLPVACHSLRDIWVAAGISSDSDTSL
jgi:hypothetical protein